MRASRETDAPRRLVIRVVMHEPRYHGAPEWPPSPARLFQALVAGAARGATLEDPELSSLYWLEGLAPPVVCAPQAVMGQAVSIWVPNNDLDSTTPDPDNVASIRTGKTVQPRLIDPNGCFLYAWTVSSDSESMAHAEQICSIAERLYQFGRGVDLAWATAAVIDSKSAELEFQEFAGDVIHPGAGDGSTTLACPARGSLDRLIERYSAGARFTNVGEGRKSVQWFKQPPMVKFAQVEYGGQKQRHFFELQDSKRMGALAVWPLVRAHDLVVEIRDRSAERLRNALVDQVETVDAVIVGRGSEQGTQVPAQQRVRIVPIPSIGHEHTNHGIRRVLVEIPCSGPLPSRDLAWAFAQLKLSQEELILIPTDDRRMLGRYLGPEAEDSRRWRTITPVVLPEAASRRRLEPGDAKDAKERIGENTHASDAVRTALRHAGVRGVLSGITVQREPFQRGGVRAESFAEGTRFPKERLWHVEFDLRSGARGPLVLGDGRYLGLGLMVPTNDSTELFAFKIVNGLAENVQAFTLTAALRRALMARYQAMIGDSKPLPSFISGHKSDGRPTTSGAHLGYLFDAERARLIVVVFKRLSQRDRQRLHAALRGITDLRAGRDGRLKLEPMELDTSSDPLTAFSKRWRSVTPYSVDRHRELGDAEAAVAADLRASCSASGLPLPTEILVGAIRSAPGRPISATAELKFAVAVPGPIVLGRTRFKGGGLFLPVGSSREE